MLLSRTGTRSVDMVGIVLAQLLEEKETRLETIVCLEAHWRCLCAMEVEIQRWTVAGMLGLAECLLLVVIAC